MVRGLEFFHEHFKGHIHQFVLIGGTACQLAMDEAGLEFRATKDLDIVLYVESLDRKFIKAFWAFINEGQYQIQQKASGKKQFYRFQKPKVENFPFMLELFSRKSDALALKSSSHITPLPMDEDISSLSAILLNDSYYEFIHEGKKILMGLPVVGPECLIPLKARAWLDLRKRKNKVSPLILNLSINIKMMSLICSELLIRNLS